MSLKEEHDSPIDMLSLKGLINRLNLDLTTLQSSLSSSANKLNILTGMISGQIEEEQSKIAEMLMEYEKITSDAIIPVSKIVRLNVGGVKIETQAKTLRAEEDSMLSAMFSGKYEIEEDENGFVFIDADGEIFKNYIIRYLRMLQRGNVTEFRVAKELKDFVISEFEYFGLKYFEEKKTFEESSEDTVVPVSTGANSNFLTRTSVERELDTWYSYICSAALVPGLYRFEATLTRCISTGNSWGLIIGVTTSAADMSANIRVTGGGYVAFTGHRTNGNETPSDVDFGERFGQGDVIRVDCMVNPTTTTLTFYKNGTYQNVYNLTITNPHIGISTACNVLLNLREI